MVNWLSQLESWDQALFWSLNQGWAHPFWDAVMPWVSNLVPLVPLLAVAVWLGLARGWRGRALLVALALLFILTDWVSTQMLRPFFERLRPYAALEGVRYCFGDDWHVSTLASLARGGGIYGLPSAHAANSMGPAFFLLRFFPRLGLALILAAILVSFSRVYLGLHYPGDVALGLAWGGLAGWVWAAVVDRLMKKWEERRLGGNHFL